VAPVLDPRVRKAGADYDSVLGRISTDWSWEPGGKFELQLTVPPNATAQVTLPFGEGSQEFGSGRHLIVASG
jgi:alpha-L-rhamnosidase